MLLLLPLNVFAATSTVKTADGDYSTPEACMNAVDPGDTCAIYTGAYSGWVQTQSGTDDSTRISLVAASGQTPVITGDIDSSGQSYVRYEGLTINDNFICLIGDRCSFIDIVDNNINNTDIGIGGSNSGDTLAGDDILIDGNIFGDRGDDVIKVNGDRWVIRNNIATDIDDSLDEHIDFMQMSCAYQPGSEILVENNLYSNITGSNTHFWLINCSTGAISNFITRYNKISTVGSGAVSNTESGGTISDEAVYNNTIYNVYAETTALTSAITGSVVGGEVGAENNIYWASLKTSDARGSSMPGNVCDGSLAYDPGFTLTVNNCLQDSTGVISNQDPLFVGAASNNFTLRAGSPAIDAGYHLTVVADADTGSGTSLVVDDAVYFQPGWAGTQADYIAVGTVTNTAQISSINYGTNTITLASEISRSDGQSVWLFKDSDGTQVLYGSAPDIGAVEYFGASHKGLTIDGCTLQ
jgi:hypothetical protein